MRRALHLLVGLWLACATAAGCSRGDTSPAALAGPPRVAELTEARGPLSLERAGVRQAASAPAALHAGDWVLTGAGAFARVRYPDGTELEVGEHSRFQLEARAGRLTLQLEEGTLLSRGRAPLSVLTRYGEAQVLEGAEVRFVLTPERSSIGVAYGEMTLLERGGAPARVLAGQTLDLLLPRTPAAPAPAAAAASPEPLEVRLAAEQGAPLVRTRDAQRFAPLPREPTPVAAGTAFRVPGGAQARLSAGTLEVRLGAGAAGQVGAAVREEGRERHALELEGGAARVSFLDTGGGVQPRELALGGLTLRASGPAAAWVRPGPRGPRVEVHAGEAEVSLDGTTHTLKAGEALAPGGGGPAPRPRPALSLPPSRAVRVYGDRPLEEVALEVPVASPPPRVEVAADASFSRVLMAGRVGTGFVVATPPARGELHWRALGEDGMPLAVGRAHFEPDGGRSRLSTRTPRQAEVAETGLKATLSFQSVLPAITFVFPAAPGASRYRLKVYRAGALQAPLLERTVSDTRCRLEAGTLGEGDYLWHAAALAPSGAELGGGRMNRLAVVYDNSRRTLALLSPRPGEVLRGATVLARGVAPLGTQLFVNGRPAPLDRKGRFALRVPGASELVFRLVSGGEGESYWVRALGSRR